MNRILIQKQNGSWAVYLNDELLPGADKLDLREATALAVKVRDDYTSEGFEIRYRWMK